MILVTGGSGLVGRELIAQLLLQGKQVTAIYNKTPLPDFNSSPVKQFHCNILDISGLEEIMQGVDEVYHCAAIVTFNRKRKQELFKINVEGTANIVNAALDAGVKKMIHVSSVASLGKTNSNELITENIKWNEEAQHSNYAKSKYLSELEVWRGIGEGLNAVIINPSIILGAGDWNAGSSQLFKSVYDEFPWFSEGTTGFVDVRDVVAAMIQLMKSDISAERFIINADNKSYKEIFNLIAKGFDKKPPHKKVTPLIASIVWRLETIKSVLTGKEPLVTKETAANALQNVYFDNTKLKQFLPSFTYRAIETTVSDTCAVLQQNLNNR
jgi:dihydroflavonol-4-reductase